MRKIIIIVFLILTFIGAAMAYTLLLNHFSLDTSPCAINPSFNCDIVNRSVYAEILGVPVALIGLLGYATMFLLAGHILFFKNDIVPHLLFAFSLGGLIFSLYLTGIEKFILHTYCPYCLASLGVITILTLLAYHHRHLENNDSAENEQR